MAKKPASASAKARPRKPKARRPDAGLKALRKLVAQTRREHIRMVHRAEQAQRAADLIAARLHDAEESLAAALERAASGLEIRRAAATAGPSRPGKRRTPKPAPRTRRAPARATGSGGTRRSTRGTGTGGTPRRGAGRTGRGPAKRGTARTGGTAPRRPSTGTAPRRPSTGTRSPGAPRGAGTSRPSGTSRSSGTPRPTGGSRPGGGSRSTRAPRGTTSGGTAKRGSSPRGTTTRSSRTPKGGSSRTGRGGPKRTRR